MISVYCLIVCVNLLYSFAQYGKSSFISNRFLQEYEQKLLLKSITAENQDEYLAHMVSPYCKLTYNEQLDRKQKHCLTIVNNIVKRVYGTKVPIIYKIIPAPVINAYRNKNQFEVMEGVDGNPKTVGFIVGKLSLGGAISIRTTKLVTIKETHKRIAQVYEDFIRLSPLPACHNLSDYGHWRTLLVRSNEAGDIMASVIVQPRGYRVRTILVQQQELKKYFLEHLPNISLFHQQCLYRHCPHSKSPYILLYGKPYLLDTLNGYKFNISQDSFFPTNKFGAEVLHDNIIRVAKLKPNTTVLDIPSGAGIISMVTSKFVRDVFGFDSNEILVSEAKYNVEFNNIHNVNFMLGEIEKQLNITLHSLERSSDIVAIVNARGLGIGLDIIRLIRSSPQINRVVYSDSWKSDNPGTVQNFIALCSNTTSQTPPFRLTKVIPIDLLPQTAFLDLILLFQRSPSPKCLK